MSLFWRRNDVCAVFCLFPVTRLSLNRLPFAAACFLVELTSHSLLSLAMSGPGGATLGLWHAGLTIWRTHVTSQEREPRVAGRVPAGPARPLWRLVLLHAETGKWAGGGERALHRLEGGGQFRGPPCRQPSRTAFALWPPRLECHPPRSGSGQGWWTDPLLVTPETRSVWLLMPFGRLL